MRIYLSILFDPPRGFIEIRPILVYLTPQVAEKQVIEIFEGFLAERSPEKSRVFVEQFCSGHVL